MSSADKRARAIIVHVDAEATARLDSVIVAICKTPGAHQEEEITLVLLTERIFPRLFYFF